MTAFLLDVNVLIALIDPVHLQHDAAHSWFDIVGKESWATCPFTESAVLRIVGHPRYPNSPGTPAAVLQILTVLRALPGHVFWPDRISLFDKQWINPERLLHSSQITDSYLLALACSNGGKLATLDQRLIASAVIHGPESLCVIA